MTRPFPTHSSSSASRRFQIKAGIFVFILVIVIIYVVAQTNLRVSLHHHQDSSTGNGNSVVIDTPRNRNAEAVDSIAKKKKKEKPIITTTTTSTSSTTTINQQQQQLEGVVIDHSAFQQLSPRDKLAIENKKKKEAHDAEVLRMQMEAMDQFIKRSEKRGRQILNEGHDFDVVHHRPGPGDELYERNRRNQAHEDLLYFKQHGYERAEAADRQNNNNNNKPHPDDVEQLYKKAADQIAEKEDQEGARVAFDWAAYHKKMAEDGDANADRLNRYFLGGKSTRRPYQPLTPEICTATQTRMREIPDHTRFDEKVRPRFAVVTLMARNSGSVDNTTTRNAMAHYSFINKLNYCRHRGYDLIVEGDEAVDHTRAPAWSKIRVLRKWLPFYEWVVWVDMDTLFMNFESSIEDLVEKQLPEYLEREMKQFHFVRQFGKDIPAHTRQIDLIISQDWNSANTGVQFIRNCKWSRRFLKLEWAVPKQYARPFWDQGAFHWLLNIHRYHTSRDELRSANDRSHVWFYDHQPRSYFNSYPANFIGNEENINAHQYVEGNWIAHFPSCRYLAVFCIPWFEKFFNKSLCINNDGSVNAPTDFVAPNHYYPPGFDYSHQDSPENQLQQQKSVPRLDRPTFPPYRLNFNNDKAGAQISGDGDGDDDADDKSILEDIQDLPKVQGVHGSVPIVMNNNAKADDTMNDFALRAKKEQDWKRRHDSLVEGRRRKK